MKPSARTQLLTDVGNTTALQAMTLVIANRQTGKPSAGILAEEAGEMLEQLKPADRLIAFKAFCDELQAFFESVPSLPRRSK